MQGNIIGIRGTGNLDSLFCFRPLSVETPKHDLGASQNWGAYENQALKTKFDVGGGGGRGGRVWEREPTLLRTHLSSTFRMPIE